MLELIKIILPWVLSAITIYMTILAGNKHRNTWALGAFNQALWLLWIILESKWGFLPMNITLWVIYLRNHFKWSRHV